MKPLSSYAGIEINGAMLEAHVNAFRLFPSHALTLLAKNGIGSTGAGSEVKVDYGRWYPMAAWLKAFQAIIVSVGPNMVFDIGREVPKLAVLPPDVKDIHASIRAVDIGYHMNHRLHGRVMFDGATGGMMEGIGHYGYEAKPGQRRIVSVCENPYPCSFDQGILTAFARRFEPGALVSKVESAPCRSHGGVSCTYAITW
jgi:hypothetical protein